MTSAPDARARRRRARRARPRLADRDARRREGARGDRASSSRRRRSSRSCACAARSPRPSSAGRIRTSAAAADSGAGRAATGTYLPLFPRVVELFDLDGYDLVISSSHCAVKSAVIGRARDPRLLLPLPDALRLGPVRRLYFGPDQVGGLPQRGAPAGHGAGWPAGTPPRPAGWTAFSRILNMLRAESADTIIASRQWCIRRWTPPSSRPIRPAAAARASCSCPPWCPTSGSTWRSRPAGASGRRSPSWAAGPNEARLRRLAGPDVQFLGWRSDEDVRTLYRQAAAVLLPGAEDFGMVPVEAQACGAPVVALGRGGARETVDRRRDGGARRGADARRVRRRPRAACAPSPWRPRPSGATPNGFRASAS